MQTSKRHATAQLSQDTVWQWLAAVPDPEIPVVSVVDLGIVRSVNVKTDAIEIDVAPTYSGCPATEVIEDTIVDALRARGIQEVRINRVLSPPWTTDWITDEGREKLLRYGIAPPAQGADKSTMLGNSRAVACPRCSSTNSSLISEFGSTACKAAYRCNDCLEPFEYFKCI